jgi:hypothetical protein
MPERYPVRYLNQRPPDPYDPLCDPDSATVARILRLHDEAQALVEETYRLLAESRLLAEQRRLLKARRG